MSRRWCRTSASVSATPPADTTRSAEPARDAVAAARRQVADLIGCDQRELFFTSGATESNNLALKGIAHAAGPDAAHIVTVATEHRAVLDPCRRLKQAGVRVTVVQPRQDGLVDLAEIEQALTPNTTLLSVMAANNEIGVVQPIAGIGALARDRGVLFHADAAQAIGKYPFRSATSTSTSCR